MHWRTRSGRLLPFLLLLATVLFASDAHGLGLIVVKGANASPEFAKAVPFGRCEEFAVSYKVQVPGAGEKVFLISEVFGMVEYDPAMLGEDLVDHQHFAPIMEVVDKTLLLQKRYPAIREEAERFLKPLRETLAYRDQGLVFHGGRWMTQDRYKGVLADRKQKQEDAAELQMLIERAQRAELQRREAEAKAATDAAAVRAKAEARAIAEAEAARKRAMAEAAAEEQRQAAMLAERKREEEALQRTLEANLATLRTSPAGAMLKAEWETLKALEKASPQAAVPGFSMAEATATVLLEQHFSKDRKALPALPGRQDATTTLGMAADGQSFMILLRPEERDATGWGACLLAFDLPAASDGGLTGGAETLAMGAVLSDVTGDLKAGLARALATCLTSLPRSGVLSRRVSLGVPGIPGYVALTRPALRDDGVYRLTVLIALGVSEVPFAQGGPAASPALPGTSAVSLSP